MSNRFLNCESTGKDGWKLVGAPIEASGLRGLRFYFKRPTQS